MEVIAKPDTHRRDYAYIELPNKLRVVIGSDPKCDKAGAALCVNVGMCYERKDLPGLAHFLEHMLFTGTKKYPSEGEYREFITQNGGTCNAYTECYRTNYMFEIKPDKLIDALDRFSRFFSEPSLTRDCTEREINAVDSEFKAGMVMPWWRYLGIMNMSANPAHPWHVAVGNNKMLLDDPKERGVDLYDEMCKFYHEFYSANGMTLCIIGRESIDDLKAIVNDKFSAIVDRGLSLPLGDATSSEPAFLPKHWNRYLIQCPAKDVKELVFSWVLPFQSPQWKTKPLRYVNHLLGHEGPGSITAVLKAKGLISACSAGGGGWIEGAFSLLNVTFMLTDKGLNAVQEIGDALFTFLGLLKQTPVEQWIFDELQKLARIKFKFGEDSRPYSLVSRMSSSLQQHPGPEVLAADVLLYDYDPAAISAVLGKLTLEGVRVRHCAKSLEARCTEKDTSYDSPMAFLPLEPAWLETWSASLVSGCSASDAQAAAASKGLNIPKPNPFVPEDLSLKELPSVAIQYPQRVPDTPKPVAYVFHRQDDKFRQPKLRATFDIRSPYVMKDARNYTIANMWSYIVQEELADFSYDATLAECNYALSVSASFGGLQLAVAGFHEKLPDLLRAVATKMKSLNSAPENTYQIVASSIGDGLKNMAYHSRPIAQVGTKFGELTTRGMRFPAEEMLNAFNTLDKSSLDGAFDAIFEKCHIEGFVLGNATPDDARALSAELVAALGVECCLDTLPEMAEAALPPGPTVWNLESTDVEDPNHAVRLVYQLGNSVEDQVMTSLLSKVLNPKFFEVLRTQQQLGYIVQMAASPGCTFAQLIGQVQGEYPPDYIRSRLDAFFDEHFRMVEETLPEEEFETCKAGLLSEFETASKNLGEEQARYYKYVSWRTYEFDRRDKLVAFLKEKVDIQALRTFVRDKVKTAPRMYVQVKKVLDKPDKELPEGAIVPEDPAELRKWSGYRETIESFTASATWTHRNAVID